MSEGARKTLSFIVESASGSRPLEVEITQLLMGGWSGRDQAQLQHHIDELGKIGVKPPARVPDFYPLSVHRLAQTDAIQVSGEETSGEAEYFLLACDQGLFVGLGSDHTDRALETVSVTLSKQICDKVIASTLWPYDEVIKNWDRLELTSWIGPEDGEVVYQQGTLKEMRSPEEMMAKGFPKGGMPVGSILFGGALGAIGGIRPSGRFRMALRDPENDRQISHCYGIQTMPIPA